MWEKVKVKKSVFIPLEITAICVDKQGSNL